MREPSIWAGAVWLVLILGGAVALVLAGTATTAISNFIYYYIDIPGIFAALMLMAFAAVAVLPAPKPVWERLARVQLWKVSPWVLGVVALALSVMGVHLVYQGYTLSMDEWMTRLQAEIFGAGQLAGIVPEDWRDYGRAMYHGFAAYDPGTGRVASDYRPGMAALYALFELVGSGPYASAVFNGLSIPLVAAVSMKLWPDREDVAAMAAVVLFASQQALAASITAYAMSAHLFFNLLWLYVFLRGDWTGHVLTVLLGGVTAALHQIHAHVFFALPFLLLLFRPFRPGLIAFYAGGYLTTHAMVYSWDWWSMNRYITAAGDGETRSLWARVLQLAQIPSLHDLATIYANIARLIAWQSLAFIPMLFAARSLVLRDKWLRLLAASVLVSLLPYIFLMPDQGHGWGYRYLHGLLGPLSLIAAFGWARLLEHRHPTRDLAFLNLLLIAGVLVMIPVRGMQMHGFVAPYAQATEIVAAIDADVVIVDSRRVFIGQDIPRNSAVALTRPVQMILHKLSPEQIETLCRDHDVVFWGADDVKAEGLRLVTFPPETLANDEGYMALAGAMASDACRDGATLPR